MKMNAKPKGLCTHQGGPAKHITPEQELRRTVMTCLLWENTAYESGQSVAKRISDIVPLCTPEFVRDLAIGAREDMKLRHAPMWIALSMLKSSAHKPYVADVLHNVIRRPDELCECLSMYWANGRTPVAAQVKRGLAAAFRKFNAYQLQKWNKQREIKLRDVLRICHPTPKDNDQAILWRQLLDGKLPPAGTWEERLSVPGADKRAVWTDMLVNNELGASALLQNLRNMTSAGVDEKLIRSALKTMRTEKVLPFRFITAARVAPHLEDVLEQTMFGCLENMPKIPGETVLLVDVSGSMDRKLSDKSELTRLDAATGLGMLLREVCESVVIITFSRNMVRIPARRGFALAEAIRRSQPHLATFLGTTVKAVYGTGKIETYLPSRRETVRFNGLGLNPDRLISLTDEQSNDPVPDPKGRGYMINVASFKNGVGYHPWIHIDGWSEHVISWLGAFEDSGF